MIVRISILGTIINLYKPRIPGNCIKFVSKLQFLTFCSGVVTIQRIGNRGGLGR